MTKKVILFTPMDGHGHINAYVGVAQVLLAKGHRIVFAVDAAWKGKLAKYGFEEQLISTDDKDDAEEFWPPFLAEHGGNILDADPYDQIDLFSGFAMKTMFEHHKKTEPKLKEIIERVKPDLLVVDANICSPSVTNSGIPWVWIFSAGPLLIVPDPEKLPPPSSGLSINSDKKEWEKHGLKSLEHHGKLSRVINDWVVAQGAPPLQFPKIHPESPYLNIYFYPEEIDYLDVRPLPSNWHQFDSLVRQSDHEVFQIPEKLKNKPGKLIYLSMGSYASAYSPMMKMLVDKLKDSPHRFIVSKG